MNLETSIEEAKDTSQGRNFTQAVDLVINVKNVDLDDPNNRFSEEVRLPNKASDDVKVCVIGETIINNAENADRTIDKNELEEFFDDDGLAKDLAQEYDFFIAEAPLMPQIGKELGSVLGPRNKMPEPMQPGDDPSDRIDELRNTISIQMKESPSIKCKIGEEDMDIQTLSQNAETVVNTVLDNLPQREHNVKDVLVKLTMGSPVSAR